MGYDTNGSDYNKPRPAIDFTTANKPMGNPLTTNSPGFNTPFINAMQSSDSAPLTRMDLSTLIYRPPNLYAQNDRSELNQMMGQQPETQFLQSKPQSRPLPTPTPTPVPVGPPVRNIYYG